MPSSPRYKYAQQLAELDGCPPTEIVPCESAQLFRFVFSDLSHLSNFLPPRMIKPNREFPDAAAYCSAYALSFFHTENEARTVYGRLRANNKKIGKAIGTHLAIVAVDHGDGALTPKDEDGHSDLHEHVECDLLPKATMLGPILPDKVDGS